MRLKHALDPTFGGVLLVLVVTYLCLVPATYAQESNPLANQAGGAETASILRVIGHLSLDGGATDIWGYVDEATGKEYAIVGSYTGVNIVDVSQPSQARLVTKVSFIDGVNVPGFDVKTWQHYIYAVTGSGGSNRGVILDIEDPDNPKLAGLFDSSHNIFITHDGIMILENPGWRVFDLTGDPTKPELLTSGGLPAQGHDAAVIDGRFFDFHGSGGTHIYDFSNPAHPELLTSIVDPNISYDHSGWTTEDGNYLFICDELASHPFPDIVVYDISNLNDPRRVGGFGDPNATVHNLFIVGNYALASYYTAGFRVFDITDPTQPKIAAEFDTAPDFTGESFNGTFGVYPFAPSGNIYVSDQDNGLYIFQLEGLPTSVEAPRPPIPDEIVLHGNYPNPFNPETTISYELPAAGAVEIALYNMLGQRLRTLVQEKQRAGAHSVRWDGSDKAGQDVPSGIYFYRFRAGDVVQTRRMLLLR